MRLCLVKPDLTYYEEYNEMMKEWVESNTQIAPWFLDKPVPTIEEFAKYVKHLDDCEHGRLDEKYCSTTSYFVVDENNKLVGAASLRHYLTIEGMNTWGHIGYGVRPTERRKGYATETLNMLLEEAKKRHIYRILIGSHTSNIGSCKVIEKCGFKFEEEITDPYNSNETIKKYSIYYVR